MRGKQRTFSDNDYRGMSDFDRSKEKQHFKRSKRDVMKRYRETDTEDDERDSFAWDHLNNDHLIP